MMNQSRTRKAPAMGESVRHRPFTKTLGETPKATKVEPHNIQKDLRNKNRIPNNLRYDLENALVGLCDVWFEEIKPYLLRNNIKLHVRRGCEHADEAEAGGDRGRLPPGAPGCSHLDPGAAPDHRRRRSASSVGSCSMLQATLRTQSRKLLQPPFKPLVPLPSQMTVTRNRRNYEEHILSPVSKVQVDGMRRRGSCPPNTHCSSNILPRLCRTYSSPSPLPAYNYPTMMEKPCYTSRVKFPILEEPITFQLAVHSTMRDQSTQTDPPPLRHRSPRRRNVGKRRRMKTSEATDSRPFGCSAFAGKRKSPSQRQKSPIQRQKPPAQRQKSPAPRQKSPVQQQKSPVSTVKQKSKSPQRQSQHRREGQARSQPAPALLRQTSPVSYMSNSQHDPLCQDGHFDRIGASYDKDVHILYETPRREENSANLNLILSPCKSEKVKKTPPWR